MGQRVNQHGIAAPGVVNPDYRYSWTRDSALTLHMLDEEFFVGNASLQNTIEDYIHAEAVRQTVYNPMGPLVPWGTGLGEPKFQINLTRFNGVWGRPQRDGPALRAITLMRVTVRVPLCQWVLISVGSTSTTSYAMAAMLKPRKLSGLLS